ncbi:MAG: NAD-dependent protein deacylase [Planctomycetota bacterium]|nr:NAD-dependent protein deacylase [Planctomycetota bacterium]
MDALEELRARLAEARRVVVLTGAGVSVASGLPVYRGAAGSLYDDPAHLRDSFGSTLRRDPAGFWGRFVTRRALLRAASPNPGHSALAALERRVPDLLLATQNVDDLHRRAGSQRLVELHGNALVERCLDDACGAAPWRSESDDAGAGPPRCPRCGGVARPDVVFFGEGADERWDPVRAFVAAGPVDLVLLVGTSGVVESPAQRLDLARPAWTCEVNPGPAAPDLAARLDARVALPAEEALPALV